MQGRPTSAPTPFPEPALHGIDPVTLGVTHLYLWFGIMVVHFYSFVKGMGLLYLTKETPHFWENTGFLTNA